MSLTNRHMNPEWVLPLWTLTISSIIQHFHEGIAEDLKTDLWHSAAPSTYPQMSNTFKILTSKAGAMWIPPQWHNTHFQWVKVYYFVQDVWRCALCHAVTPRGNASTKALLTERCGHCAPRGPEPADLEDPSIRSASDHSLFNHCQHNTN